MAHVPPSSLHTSLGNLGSTEPLSSWRSEGPDHTHTTHARTHKHTQRNQEEGPDMAHVPPSSLHTSLGNLGSTEPLSSWRASLLLEVRGPDHTHTTHARTHKHTQRNQEEGPDMAHVPPSSLHTSLGKPGLHRASLLLEHTQRNQEGGLHRALPQQSLHTSLGKQLHRESLEQSYPHSHQPQRNQEEGPDMAHVPPSLHTSLGKPGLHRASLLLEVRGA
ncbi:hypothetical protein D5F01_LYC25200 [Larimichthys crocea]|uniref:Uncharacterized protein n=1 Tax=Larimichthys crocea TaxID=215358 RepID=A0A6G0HDD9_LARCR|nr:hypothetical protein D5F01_LYC25200 [Larimichthys crocea]